MLVSEVGGLSVWSLYVFSVSVKVLAGFSRFLTQSKNMRFCNLGILNWPVQRVEREWSFNVVL